MMVWKFFPDMDTFNSHSRNKLYNSQSVGFSLYLSASARPSNAHTARVNSNLEQSSSGDNETLEDFTGVNNNIFYS